MKAILLAALLLLLGGCASLDPAPVATMQLRADERFAPPSEPIGARDLFALDTNMRAYLRSPAFQARLRTQGMRHGLVDALYTKSDLKLEYESRITRNASETYAARRGNCLSLVIMTAAFARELGMTVYFRSVEVPDEWSRAAGMYVASGHINIALGARHAERVPGADADEILIVDFLPQLDAVRLRARIIDEREVVALYLNNRAAEALIQGRVDDAYWWAREAVQTHPSSAEALNTLGVVYQQHGDLTLAETAFEAALAREPENMAVLRNLEPLLKQLGKTQQASSLARRIAAIEPVAPYTYFDQGMTALQQGDFDGAARLFAREVKRAPYNDEFRFWLGIAHLRLGHLGDARKQIALALEHSTRSDMREVYSSKLRHLRGEVETGTRMR